MVSFISPFSHLSSMSCEYMQVNDPPRVPDDEETSSGNISCDAPYCIRLHSLDTYIADKILEIENWRKSSYA